MGDKGETSVNSCGPRNPEWETSVETSVGDKWGTSGGQVGDKCKLMRPKAPRVRDKCGRQGGDSCKTMRPKTPRMKDKGKTSVNSCGPRNPEWETSVGDKCGRQVWETSVGDKCKLMRPKAPRVRDKCRRQGGDKRKLMQPKKPRMGDKGETSVNSRGPRHPEWETRGRQV